MARRQFSFTWGPNAGRDPAQPGLSPPGPTVGSGARPSPASGAGGGPWLTSQEAAQYLGLRTVQALYKRIERASVPRDAVRRWGRQFRFKREALDALDGASWLVAVCPLS